MNPPIKEKETLTSAGMETATQTVDRIKNTLASYQEPQSSVIPTDVIENPPTEVTVPQVEVDPNIANGALAASDSLLADFGTQTEALQSQYSADKDLIRALNEQLGFRDADRNTLLEDKGVNAAQTELDAYMSRIRRNRDQMANFDDIATIKQGQLEGQGQDSRLVSRNQAAIARNRQLERATQAIELRTQIADAELLQGNIKNATDQIDAALDAKYNPIEQALQLEMLFLQDTKDFLTTAQSNEADARIAKYEQQMKEINDAKALVNAAVASGGMQAGEAEKIMNLTPEEQIAAANAVLARVATEDRNLARQTELLQQQNLQSQIDARNADAAGTNTVAGMSNTLSLVRDSVSRVLGRSVDPNDPEAGNFDALFQAAGANPLMEFARRNIGSSATDFTRLNAQLDTIKSNMLMLGSDPNIRQFFGPQMSEADVRMMMAAATRLQAGNMNPEEIRDEVGRIDEFIGKLDAAMAAGPTGSVSPNTIIAPDGTAVEIID